MISRKNEQVILRNFFAGPQFFVNLTKFIALCRECNTHFIPRECKSFALPLRIQFDGNLKNAVPLQKFLFSFLFSKLYSNSIYYLVFTFSLRDPLKFHYIWKPNIGNSFRRLFWQQLQHCYGLVGDFDSKKKERNKSPAILLKA